MRSTQILMLKSKILKRNLILTLNSILIKFLFSVTKDNYEKSIYHLLRQAIVLDHSKSPCEESFIPDTKGQVYVLFIKMNSAKDYSTWLQVAKCFKIWDLDARGYHKSMWRFFMKGNHLLVVGVPHSPYS